MSFEFLSNACIPGYRKLIPCTFEKKTIWIHWSERTDANKFYNTFFWAGRTTEARRVWWDLLQNCGKSLFGLDFSHQPTTGLGPIKQRHREKDGTIMRAFSEYHGHRFFLWAVVVLLLFSVWNRMIPTPHERFAFDVSQKCITPKQIRHKVHRTYSRKTCAWVK